MALIDFLDRGARLNPGGACLVAGDVRLSYTDVQRLSCRLANRLRTLRCPREGKGAVLSINDPVAYTCALGIVRAGMAWVPVNPKNSDEDNRYQLDFFDCEVLFFHSLFAENMARMRAHLPRVKHWVCLDRDLDGAPGLETWLGEVSDRPPAVVCAPDDVCLLAGTGGTTGRPKGVQLTHRNLQTFVANYLMTLHYDPAEAVVNLAAAPLTHGAGFFALPALARGGTIVILTKPDVPQMLDAIERHRVTDLFLPPTVIYRMLEHPGIEQRDFSSLKYFIYGAAPTSVSKLKRAIEIFGPVMTQLFGQMEAPATITSLLPSQHFQGGRLASDARLSSCGVPTPLVDVAILDDDNRPLPDGETGEICARGDLVMKGYYKDPEATAAAIVDGWLHTGDVGFRDAEGYLHIVDRKKDMIITGGFNVFPQEIEQVLWSHPAVRDCAVIGVPDPEWGEAVKAVVELRERASVAAAELIALCKARLGSVKAPKSIEFTDSLPRSPNGKVLKRALRDHYWQGHERKIG